MNRIGYAGLRLLLFFLAVPVARADQGMWMLNQIGRQNLDRMRDLGFEVLADSLYAPGKPGLSDAVVIFGEGCTGVVVSGQGLVFTNHHCGYGSVQQLSSVERDYLKDGFVSQSLREELPVPGLRVRFLRQTIDVTDRIVRAVDPFAEEYERIGAVDSIGAFLCDSIGRENPFAYAELYPYYAGNVYYLQVYDEFRDVRLVLAPPSSLGRFGGDTDNWMWPRHTADFSVFRVYAGAGNAPAEYALSNEPYRPRYVPEVSLRGYEAGDYAMTIGFPGSTERYLSSWGVKQRMERENRPRIEARGIKQDIWKKAMRASDAVRIQYAAKYQLSSNYWKNAIGMNRGLARLGVVDRKRREEAAFAEWLERHPEKKAVYGDVLGALQRGYTESDVYTEATTYLTETLHRGVEIVGLARAVLSLDDRMPADELQVAFRERIEPFYKDYDPALDREVLPVMMRLAKERLPAEFLPDIFPQIDRKYKGDYDRYAADLFRKSVFTGYEKLHAAVSDPKKFARIGKDPAAELALSVLLSVYELGQLETDAYYDRTKGERLYVSALQEMYPDSVFASDANFTMRLSYGSVGGYRPYDGAWFDFYSTHRGVLEKADPSSDEFAVQPEILDLFRRADFGPYGNGQGELNLCFLSNNDITGGNSGSPVFDKSGRLIGLAFDGNWEAMSGDIAFEPDLQRTISVDIRYVLFLIDRWARCPRLLGELKLAR